MYTAGPSGWLRYLASQTPLSRSIGSLASCSATGPFDLGDLGIIEQQLNQSSNQLGSQALPSCDAFASDWSIPRTLDRFFFPPSVPASKSNVRQQYPIGSPFSIAMYGVTDSALQNAGGQLLLYVSKCRALLLLAPTTRRYEIDLCHHEHRKVSVSRGGRRNRCRWSR